MKYSFRYGEEMIQLNVEQSGGAITVATGLPPQVPPSQGEVGGGNPQSAIEKARWLPNGLLELRFDNRVIQAPIIQQGDQRLISWNGRVYRFEREISGRRGKTAHHASDGFMIAPMPCLVVKVSVKEGDAVTANQELVVLEAMKTVQAIVSPFDGIVEKVHVSEKDLVTEGAPLVEIKESAG